MEDLRDKKIGELVAEDYRKATVFKKYGLDFCCGGGKTIEEACQNKNVDVSSLIKDLASLDDEKESSNEPDFNSMSLTDLADYIEQVHHKYVLDNLQSIQEFSNKVAKVHGNHNPETIEINKLFTETAQELAAHLRKEELILFPYIKKLEKALFNDEYVEAPFGTVKNPIAMMEHEHDSAGDNFKKIARLSNNYTPPEYACNTYRVLYSKLKEFEEDLHKHVHLENNILFPKAIKLEQKIS
ncbi:MAG TPA: iron-sulfur cluster repair di-iron protein [Flavobacteriales bacterium]|nr:iron-sulfur cluster repair di-iron protein [Flavobacteriales bacterium]|tara:strand:+ start:83083 stop:83805 length:723 start_codon:yes stop_codon:yes gene_type:complete